MKEGSYHIENVTHHKKTGRQNSYTFQKCNIFGKGNQAVHIPYGIGCPDHNNCFTCPLPECCKNDYDLKNNVRENHFNRDSLPYKKGD